MFCKLKKKCHQRLSVLLQNSIGIRLAKSTFYQLMTVNPPAVRQAWSMQWSNTALLHRVQRRCVCRQNIKTRRKPLKKWVILIALQFRYTFYVPQTKRLRARKIGLQSFFLLGTPFGRRTVRQREYGLRLLIFKIANNN